MPKMRCFILVAFACLLQQSTGARMHQASTAQTRNCEDAGGKPEIAACMCESANSKGSPQEVATECGKLRMQVMMKAMPWSCAVTVKGSSTTCGPMCPWRAGSCGKPGSKDNKPTTPVVEERQHDDNIKDDDEFLDDLEDEEEELEDDLIEDNVVVDEDEEDGDNGGDGGNGGGGKTPIPEDKFDEEAEKCIINPRDPKNKKNEALCICGLANGDGLTPLELKKRCGMKLKILMMRKKVMPWSCIISRTGSSSQCTPMFPFRATKDNKDKDPVDVIVVEERNDDDTKKQDDDIDDFLEEDPEVEKEIEKEIEEPTPKCLSLSKTATPGTLATKAQLKAWCGGDECGGKLKMRPKASCGLADGQVEGPLLGGLVKDATQTSFHCYINCVADDAPNVKPGSLTADCVWSPGTWGACSRSCGGGQEKQSVNVKIQPVGLGKPCPAPTVRPCNTKPCPVDCSGYWGHYGGCSGSCGHNNGRQHQYYQITTKPKHGGAACPRHRQNSRACTARHCPPPPDCFPADALVETPSGPKTMSELRVGDVIRSVDGAGRSIYDEVYFFGHADNSKSADYVNLKLSGNDHSLQLSNKHFLPTCPKHGERCKWSDHIHVYAGDVQPGDYVWMASAEQTSLFTVLETSVIVKEGLYNPYTLSGKIVVNGVVASAHSNWILDEWTPLSMSQYLPAAYQVLFLPGRMLYQSLGASAADFLDVNNPQLGANHGYGPEFLGACLLSGLIVVVMGLRGKSSK